MKLLKVREVAARWGVGYDFVLELIHAKHLPTVDMPGRRSYLIREEDADAFIESRVSGTVTGTDGFRKPPKTAPSKRGRTNPKTAKPVDKYVWMQDYTKEGTPCS